MAGDKEDDHRHGIVNLDIDLLAFGNLRLHEEDWHREYIKELLKEINSIYEKDYCYCIVTVCIPMC